jgi:hypothetical protein
MNEKTIEKICMRDTCKDNVLLTTYKCSTDRPIIYLGKRCWCCHSDEFLVNK